MLKFILSRDEAEAAIEALLAVPEDEFFNHQMSALESLVVGCGMCKLKDFDNWLIDVRLTISKRVPPPKVTVCNVSVGDRLS